MTAAGKVAQIAVVAVVVVGVVAIAAVVVVVVDIAVVAVVVAEVVATQKAHFPCVREPTRPSLARATRKRGGSEMLQWVGQQQRRRVQEEQTKQPARTLAR